jgi:hypothetical protein
LYSSCNPQSLADDLRRLPRYQLLRVQLFDLFAQRSQLLGGVLPSSNDSRSGIFGELACAACHGLTRSMRNEVADILAQERNIFANAGKQIGGAGILMGRCDHNVWWFDKSSPST